MYCLIGYYLIERVKKASIKAVDCFLYWQNFGRKYRNDVPMCRYANGFELRQSSNVTVDETTINQSTLPVTSNSKIGEYKVFFNFSQGKVVLVYKRCDRYRKLLINCNQ